MSADSQIDIYVSVPGHTWAVSHQARTDRQTASDLRSCTVPLFSFTQGQVISNSLRSLRTSQRSNSLRSMHEDKSF